MCKIEQFDVVYPNRYREPREQLVPCRRATRSQPCRVAKVIRLKDRFASASESPPIQPHIVTIEPRDLGNSRLRSSSMERKRDPITGMTLNFRFWNPFSSKKKEKERRGRRRPPPCPPVIHFDPSIPPPPPEPCVPPDPPRRWREPTPITVHHSSEEDEDGSSSPPEANREHGRRTRSLSSIRRYEAEKERIRQREFRERERLERNIREAREAQERAALVERLERQRARDEERERVASLERRERQREREERRERAALVERLARQREREERERQERRQAQQLREDRARRYWEEEDRARRRAADRAERQLREEQARYLYAEQRRRDRARQANIPLRPRHHVVVHHDDLDRGDRVIRNDIWAENRRQSERRAERSRGRYDDGWLRRRNTIDGGRRWHDGYWGNRR